MTTFYSFFVMTKHLLPQGPPAGSTPLTFIDINNLGRRQNVLIGGQQFRPPPDQKEGRGGGGWPLEVTPNPTPKCCGTQQLLFLSTYNIEYFWRNCHKHYLVQFLHNSSISCTMFLTARKKNMNETSKLGLKRSWESERRKKSISLPQRTSSTFFVC